MRRKIQALVGEDGGARCRIRFDPGGTTGNEPWIWSVTKGVEVDMGRCKTLSAARRAVVRAVGNIEEKANR